MVISKNNGHEVQFSEQNFIYIYIYTKLVLLNEEYRNPFFVFFKSISKFISFIKLYSIF